MSVLSTEEFTHKPSQYALLIGINAYPNPDDRLNGCVKDVHDINGFLETQSEHIRVKILTATQSEDCTIFKPKEDPMSWPTHRNVTSALNDILSDADPGNCVYVHFSGHGSRKDDNQDKAYINSTKPVALVLLSGQQDSKPPCQYLWGRELANTLKNMVQKGLVVTLVLDCCFSGSVMRRGEVVRFLAYDDVVDNAFPTEAPKCLDLADSVGISRFRNASMLPNWLANPEGYSILAACGPTQRARELKDDQNQPHGVLSYYLYKSCVKFGGLGCSMGIIYQHVQAYIRDLGAQQTPCLFGNMDIGFFGNTPSQRDHRASHVAILRNADQIVRLPIGEAQGVCIGDLFRLWRLNPETDESRKAVTACVTQVSPLGCTLRPYGQYRLVNVRTGWLATPLTRLALQNYSIEISRNTPDRDRIEEAVRQSSLAVSTSLGNEVQQNACFLVRHDDLSFEISDASGVKIPHLPELPIASTSPGTIAEILGHLTRYWIVKDLARAVPAAANLPCHVWMEMDGKKFPPSGLIDLTHGDTIHLKIKNEGDRDLYLFVYNMDAFWEIENMSKKSHTIIPPHDKDEDKTCKITMTVRDKIAGEPLSVSDDIIKVLVATQWTSFDILILPELGKSPDTKIPSKGTNRGGTQDSEEDWQSFDFPIRTTRSIL